MGKVTWVSVVDRDSRVMRIVRVLPSPQTWFVRLDPASSVSGHHSVWRSAPLNQPDVSPDDPVAMVELSLEAGSEPPYIDPAFLWGDLVDPPPLRTLWATPGSFMWRTVEHSTMDPVDSLDAQVREFDYATVEFGGFTRRSFALGDLWDNTHWDWGHEPGVYCFVSADGEPRYVGRALDALGSRIWNQMNSQQEDEWAAVVNDRNTQVVVYFVDRHFRFMASALEQYLIDHLKPKFNLKCQ